MKMVIINFKEKYRFSHIELLHDKSACEILKLQFRNFLVIPLKNF